MGGDRWFEGNFYNFLCQPLPQLRHDVASASNKLRQWIGDSVAHPSAIWINHCRTILVYPCLMIVSFPAGADERIYANKVTLLFFYKMMHELSEKPGAFLSPMANNSTSKFKSALGGIAPGAPRAPYP